MSCLNKDTNILLSSDSKVSVKESFYNSLSARLSSNSRVKLTEGIYRNIKAALSSSSSVLANENIVFAIKESLTDPSVGQIKAYSNVNFGIKSYIPSISKFKNTFTDKFAGYKPDFVAYEKLYPITDISFKSKPGNTNLLVYKVENNTISSSNIYSSVDEGVFIGDYTKNNGTSVRTSDDSSSIFLTWRMFSQGDLQYKFKVNKPLSVAKSSYFALRASAPFGQYTTKKPQHYKFYDIKLEDPSGNLIIKYEDIDVQGDKRWVGRLRRAGRWVRRC